MDKASYQDEERAQKVDLELLDLVHSAIESINQRNDRMLELLQAQRETMQMVATRLTQMTGILKVHNEKLAEMHGAIDGMVEVLGIGERRQ